MFLEMYFAGASAQSPHVLRQVMIAPFPQNVSTIRRPYLLEPPCENRAAALGKAVGAGLAVLWIACCAV